MITEWVKKDNEGKEVNTRCSSERMTAVDKWGSVCCRPQEDSLEHASELPMPRGKEAEGFIHPRLAISQQSQLPGVFVLPKYRLSEAFRQSNRYVKKQKCSLGTVSTEGLWAGQ